MLFRASFACLVSIGALAALASCGDSTGISDLDERDASVVDSGRRDAGGPPDASNHDDAGFDAGASDAGPADSGTDDAGTADAGPADAGNLDAGNLDAGPVDAGPRALPWTIGPDEPPPAEWLDTPPRCTRTDWLAKYFHYRTRLRGDGTAAFPGFVSVGAKPGESVPATMRTPTADCATDWWVADAQCRQLNVPNANGKIQWGDGTIWLGWYLAMLGSEYKAFTLLGVDTAQTENDLYYALQAFNRLDEVAETFFNRQPAKDGFFIRGDAPSDFIFKDAAHTIMRFPRNDAGLTGFGCILSGTACGTVTTKDGYFESLDQVVGLLPGLAMVAKMVPPGTLVNGLDLANEAQAITHRIVMFLKDHNWVIRDPTGETPPNAWGGNTIGFSNQIAKGANFITGGSQGESDYRDWRSIAAGGPAFGLTDASWLLQNLSNQSMLLKLETVSDEWPPEKLASRAADWNAPVFPMMNAFLHGRTVPANVSTNEVEAMLTTAPCSGPCHGMPGCEEAPGWKGENRFKSPEQRNGSPYGMYGDYNGIDYMILHNLYVIMRQGQYLLTYPQPTICRRDTTLETLIKQGAGASTTYDLWESCNGRDWGRDFCGRSFAGWLDEAYRGQATIFIAGARLTCTPGSVCQLNGSTATGTTGNDLYLGWNGNDVFEGGAGNDCLYGFDGADSLKGNAGRDELHGGPGNDTLCGESCQLTDVNGDPDVLFGDDGADNLNGGPAADELYGGPGNDVIRGDQGGDFIEGDDGDDDLDGEMGEDTIHGGNGNDKIRGGMEGDILFGDDGRDKLDGAWGDDSLNGGAGDDFLMGGDGKDSLNGGPGSDRLCGGCGDDTLWGGWEGTNNDSCRAKAANTFLCFGEQDPLESQCESGASPDNCRDGAFDDW